MEALSRYKQDKKQLARLVALQRSRLNVPIRLRFIMDHQNTYHGLYLLIRSWIYLRFNGGI